MVRQTNQISVETTINDDMSLSWKFPDELNSTGLFMSLHLKLNDGTIIDSDTYGGVITFIDRIKMIKYIADVYPKKINYIRCSYGKYDDDYQTKDEWYFDINVSNIRMLVEGEPIKPGVYTHFKGQWVPECISLSDGESFKENAYYLISSYEHSYRREEYNAVGYGIFSVKEASDLFCGAFDFYGGGGIFLEEMYIQEIILYGDAITGFILYTTPKSYDVFTVEEGSDPS